nr:hypothetical protein ICEMyc226_00057 [Mycolicibacterium sp.]
MNVQQSARMAFVFVVGAAALTSACHSTSASSDSAMSCATYNKGTTTGDGDVANTNALSALLLAHSINPAADNHYVPTAGSSILNVSEASAEVDKYCASNPDSTIDKGVNWSNFKTK